MRKALEASVPTIRPSTHLYIHHVFPLVHHQALHPSPSTLPEKEVRINNSVKSAIRKVFMVIAKEICFCPVLIVTIIPPSDLTQNMHLDWILF